MKISDIDSFFEQVDRRIDTPIKVLITGGAAAILFGSTRMTQDIDFEVQFKLVKGKPSEMWPKLQNVFDDVTRLTGLSSEYSDDIDRWSSIKIPGKKGRLHKKIGKVEVRVLEPGLWAIGKLSRYLDTDVLDLVNVFSKLKPSAQTVAKLWGKALGESPPSPSQSEFRRHVDHFFDKHTEEIWGKKEEPEGLKALFLKSAQSAQKRK